MRIVNTGHFLHPLYVAHCASQAIPQVIATFGRA